MKLWSLAAQTLWIEKKKTAFLSHAGTHIHRQDMVARRRQGWTLSCRLGLVHDLGKRLHR